MLEFTDRLMKGETLTCTEVFDASEILYSPSTPEHEVIANRILKDVMRFRRISGPQTDCALSPCEKCMEPHLSKIISAVERGSPVTFVLPAFPGKSPNLSKVLGVLPDMAERRALLFLQYLCDLIKEYYVPGAQLILCSDGRVFSDVVGMRDEDVSAYKSELSKMIIELNLTSISTFDLDDLYEGLSFNEMRIKLMEEYGESLSILEAAVSRGGKKSKEISGDDLEANRLYCGITRFLVEDAMFPGQNKSRTAIQKESKTRAYAVIQRSKAWGDWVLAQFPNAIRLSIHPQTCGSKKMGIRLMEPDHWLTPWHGVAVEVGERFILLKRTEAEKLHAELIYVNGRPSHYFLADESALSKLGGVENGN